MFRLMETKLHIDDELIQRASELTGIEEKNQLVRLGLEALIARENSRRLGELGGSEKDAKQIRRRRPGNLNGPT